VFRGDCDTDARRDERTRAIDLVGLTQCVLDTSNEAQRALDVVLLTGHDHEFVAAESADRIFFTDHRLQAPRHFAEQLVAATVTKRVVDLFEVVEGR